jgi:hypothetical protein
VTAQSLITGRFMRVIHTYSEFKPHIDAGLSDTILSVEKKEAERVLKQNGIITVWTYNLLIISPEIDSVIKYFYFNVVGEFWTPERKLVENGYENIPFPFYKIPSPSFRMSAKWTIKQLITLIPGLL